jgi:hypothetical protein
MDSKEQVVLMLKTENDYLKRENEFLKKEFIRHFGNYPTMDGNNMANEGFLPHIKQSQSRGFIEEVGML